MAAGKFYKTTPKVSTPISRIQKEWSERQLAIFDNIHSGSGNLAISAVPGAGKTTTIVEGLYHVPKGKTAIFLAFAKDIQTELEARVPAEVPCKTFHSLGMGAIIRAFGKVSINKNKLKDNISHLLGDINIDASAPDSDSARHERVYQLELREALRKCTSLAKGTLAYSNEEIQELIFSHKISVPSKNFEDKDSEDNYSESFIQQVQKLLEISASQKNVIDFDDMLFFCAHFKLKLQTYDYIFVDEVQDLNAAQVYLLLALRHKTSRVFIVGDPSQAIFVFRGANLDSFERVRSALNAAELPLDVSYRCAKSIVQEAANYNPSILPSPEASLGTVESVNRSRMMDEAIPGDFILSRTNAPLVSVCMRLLKEGKRANIQGRDLGESLCYQIKKSGQKTVESFLLWLDKTSAKECERLQARDKDSEHILDRQACLTAFCEGKDSLKEVQETIQALFSDNKHLDGKTDESRIICATTHKCKGLERDRAWLLRSTFRPEKGKEEQNIFYVAITRAKNSLFYVSDK